MLRFRPGRWLRNCAVAVIAVAVSAQAATAQGITFDITSTMSSSALASSGAAPIVRTMRGSATNSATRLDGVTAAGTPGADPGDYMLTTSAGMVLVHPASKTYVDFLDQTLGVLNSMPPEVLAQMNIAAITGTTETVPGSQAIDGRPTQRYRTVLSYSMNLMGQTIPTTMTGEYWIAKLPVHFMNPLVGEAKSPVAAGPMAELIKKQAELYPKAPDGVVVKSIMTTSVAVNGQSMLTTVTTEVKNVKEGAVDPATMALPAGYTKVAK